jgi:segregation and condensation protein A
VQAVAEAGWIIHTDVFEGPLDLLLYLVRRDGVDVTKVRIADICDAYLGYLDRLRDLRLNVAADYLVMAATLVHLKSLAMLPRAPSPTSDDGEEDEDPTEALARQLEEYQRIKEAAEALDARDMLGRDSFARPVVEVDSADRPVVAGIDAFALLDMYWDMLARQAVGPTVHTLPDDGPDLERCCRFVLDCLDVGDGRGELGTILRQLPRAGERVVSFVAALEMVRMHWIGVSQQRHLGPVQVWYENRDAVDLRLLTGRIRGEAPDDE